MNKQQILDELEGALEFNRNEFQKYYDRNNGEPTPENLKQIVLLYEAAQAFAKILRAEIEGTAKLVRLPADERTAEVIVDQVFRLSDATRFGDTSPWILYKAAIKASPDMLAEMWEV